MQINKKLINYFIYLLDRRFIILIIWIMFMLINHFYK